MFYVMLHTRTVAIIAAKLAAVAHSDQDVVHNVVGWQVPNNDVCFAVARFDGLFDPFVIGGVNLEAVPVKPEPRKRRLRKTGAEKTANDGTAPAKPLRRPEQAPAAKNQEKPRQPTQKGSKP